jgi:sulfate adenylyltransferase subunit 1 (EFTu-like GTPase family)
MITLVPVAIVARRQPDMDWRQYEAAVWRGFIASGTPIILWQIGEAMVRQIELLRYAATREQAPVEDYADDSSTMATRSGERTGSGDPGC